MAVCLFPVVHVNRVLLVAAATLQAFICGAPLALHFFTLPLGNLHCNTGPPSVTLAIPQLESRGNPTAMKMSKCLPLKCCYLQSILQLSISSSLNGVHVCWGVDSCCRGGDSGSRCSVVDTCARTHRYQLIHTQGGH